MSADNDNVTPLKRPIEWGPWNVWVDDNGLEWWVCKNIAHKPLPRLEPYKTDLAEVITPPVWGKPKSKPKGQPK